MLNSARSTTDHAVPFFRIQNTYMLEKVSGLSSSNACQ
jgi:hypothetical protein